MDDSQIIYNSNTFPETICLTILTEWIWRGKKSASRQIESINDDYIPLIRKSV